jgi:hypothetical protein
MAAAAAGLASMAHLTATSTWLVLLPGFILAGIGLGITSTGLASAALSAVEPARAGMATGLTNTLRQVGTASGLNDVLLAAAAFAVLGTIAGFAFGADPARRPPPRAAPGELSAQSAPPGTRPSARPAPKQRHHNHFNDRSPRYQQPPAFWI